MATFEHSGIAVENESLILLDVFEEDHTKRPPLWPKRAPSQFEQGMRKVAEVAAWMVRRRRELVYLDLSEGECIQDRVPYGSTERAVFTRPLVGAPWWHFAVYRHSPDENDEGCIDLRLLGWQIEVWYRPKGYVSGAV